MKKTLLDFNRAGLTQRHYISLMIIQMIFTLCFMRARGYSVAICHRLTIFIQKNFSYLSYNLLYFN